MPIVAYTTIGGGLAGVDKAALNRFMLLERHAVFKKRYKYSRLDKKNLPTYSLLNEIGQAWSALTTEQKTAWADAAALCDLEGYNFYTQDKSYRITHELSGNATPSLFHQYLVGHLQIAEGAGDTYFKQAGDIVIEFPASLTISYKASLSNDPANGNFIKIRLKYQYDEGAGELTQTDELELDLSTDWKTDTLPITEHTGLTGSFLMEIETSALKGDFWFDNFYLSAANGILSKDPFCEAVNKRWQLLKYPAGVLLETIYPDT